MLRQTDEQRKVILLRNGLSIREIGEWAEGANDLGYIDLEEKTLQALENPFGQKCNLCLRYDM